MTNQKETIVERSNKRVAVKKDMQGISILANSVKYFLEHAFIIDYEDSYRLLVIHRWKLLTDRCYKTLKGARIAFLKLYNNRRWQEKDVPEWSNFYNPGVEYYNLQTAQIER